jgi:hypothetical protein
MGHYIQFDRLASGLLCHQTLASKFHLPDRLPILDLYHIFVTITNHSCNHCKLAITESFKDESGYLHQG